MKLRLLLLPLVAVLAIALGAIAQEKKDDQTELGAKMEKAGKAWRAVKGGASDATKNEETLKALAVVKENLSAGLKMEPAKAATVAADQKAKFVADYHAALKAEIATIEKIEAAIKAGKNDEAAKLVGEADQAQKDAHKQFKQGKKKQG